MGYRDIYKESNEQAEERFLLVMERIAEIAAQIAERKTAKIVMIAGPSSSGKTTFSHRLSAREILALGLTVGQEVRPYPSTFANK